MEDKSEITSQQGPYFHQRRHRGLMSTIEDEPAVERHVSQSLLYTMPNSRPVYSNHKQQEYGYSRRTDRDQYSGTVDQELTSVQLSMESATISHSERRRRRQ